MYTTQEFKELTDSYQAQLSTISPNIKTRLNDTADFRDPTEKRELIRLAHRASAHHHITSELEEEMVLKTNQWKHTTLAERLAVLDIAIGERELEKRGI